MFNYAVLIVNKVSVVLRIGICLSSLRFKGLLHQTIDAEILNFAMLSYVVMRTVK